MGHGPSRPPPPPHSTTHGNKPHTTPPTPTSKPTPTLNPTTPNTTPSPTPDPDPPIDTPASTENPAAEPSLSTDSVSPAASAEDTSTGTTAAEASPIQSSLINESGSSDASPVSGSLIGPVSPTGSDFMFRTKDGEGNDADPTLTPFSAPPFQALSTFLSNSPGVDLPNGGLSPNGASGPFATSPDGGPPVSPHNPAAIILGVLVPLFAILLAAAGYIGYRRYRRLRDRREWERTHEEIAVAVRDAGPSIQPWVRFPDTPGASERGGETPAPAPERNSVYSGIEQESSFDGTSLYTDHDRKQ